MVVGCKQDITLKLYQVVVESLNGLQIQMIRRCVKYEAVSILQLHAGYHATHLLSARKHIDMFKDVLLLEEHTA